MPISFVPFALYADTDDDAADILLEIEPLPKVQAAGESGGTEWQGDWLHNTNETYAQGAYKKMFDQGVIAIYGYPNGPDNLAGSAKGERVFAYVNLKEILAVGHIVDGQVKPGNSIFGKEKDGEFHVKVEWETIVDDNQGVTREDVWEANRYNPPYRSVFCRIHQHDAADWIADELRRRHEG